MSLQDRAANAIFNDPTVPYTSGSLAAAVLAEPLITKLLHAGAHVLAYVEGLNDNHIHLACEQLYALSADEIAETLAMLEGP